MSIAHDKRRILVAIAHIYNYAKPNVPHVVAEVFDRRVVLTFSTNESSIRLPDDYEEALDVFATALEALEDSASTIVFKRFLGKGRP
jgi:hypothetical protein